MPFCRRFVLAVVVALLAAPAAAGALDPPALSAGTYAQIDTVTKKPLQPGNTVVFARSKDGWFGFSLNAIRALDSNQGYVAGRLRPGRVVVWSQKSELGNCRLTFVATVHGMTVVQDTKFGDCGFGHGVLADGTYVLEAEKPLPKT
jgi:hypothetical protein